VLGHRTVRLYPLFHPAAALYTPRMLETLREDFSRIPDLLALPAPETADGGRPTADPEPDIEPEVLEIPEAPPDPAIEDPLEMERLADANLDRAHTRFIVTDDAAECVERIRPYVELGFNRLVFHAPGADQVRFLDRFSADVLPLLRREFAGVPA